MSSADSLFWIVLIGLAVGGLYLITKKKKWRLVGKIVLIGVAVVALIAMMAWAWNWYSSRPYEVTTLGNVSLGMSPIDVTLSLGKPTEESADNNAGGERRFIYRDYTGGVDYFIGFSTASNVVTIICSPQYYRTVFGLGKYDSEKSVVSKLGEPTNVSISSDALRKAISYEKWNVAFAIEKGSVAEVCVVKGGKLKYADEYSVSDTSITDTQQLTEHPLR